MGTPFSPGRSRPHADPESFEDVSGDHAPFASSGLLESTDETDANGVVDILEGDIGRGGRDDALRQFSKRKGNAP
jgi:hypothetical protein